MEDLQGSTICWWNETSLPRHLDFVCFRWFFYGFDPMVNQAIPFWWVCKYFSDNFAPDKNWFQAEAAAALAAVVSASTAGVARFFFFRTKNQWESFPGTKFVTKISHWFFFQVTNIVMRFVWLSKASPEMPKTLKTIAQIVITIMSCFWGRGKVFQEKFCYSEQLTCKKTDSTGDGLVISGLNEPILVESLGLSPFLGMLNLPVGVCVICDTSSVSRQ